MPQPSVLSLCDLTGNMVRPWADAGFSCFCVDVQHPAGASPLFDGCVAIGCSVEDRDAYLSLARPIGIVFAFPPCTHLAVSGARWWASKGMALLCDALWLVDNCRDICERSGAPWMVENPVGRLSTCWRKPNYSFDPCDYGGYLQPPGDAYTKRTCLWTGGGFVMPEPRRVEPVEGSKMHRLPPSADRANLRSETPTGFARAVFEANHSTLLAKR